MHTCIIITRRIHIPNSKASDEALDLIEFRRDPKLEGTNLAELRGRVPHRVWKSTCCVVARAQGSNSSPSQEASNPFALTSSTAGGATKPPSQVEPAAQGRATMCSEGEAETGTRRAWPMRLHRESISSSAMCLSKPYACCTLCNNFASVASMWPRK